MLAINKSIEGGKALFSLEGRLDTVTAPDLEKEISVKVAEMTNIMIPIVAARL